jgi:hypothetical protein
MSTIELIVLTISGSATMQFSSAIFKSIVDKYADDFRHQL